MLIKTAIIKPDGVIIGTSSYLDVSRGPFSTPPKVVTEPPLTIEQLCTSALSRLYVSINANTTWQLLQFKNRCQEYNYSNNIPDLNQEISKSRYSYKAKHYQNFEYIKD